PAGPGGGPDAPPPPPTLQKVEQAMAQLGTLGSGNHFVELAFDERGLVWILLHSGCRGGGNKLAPRPRGRRPLLVRGRHAGVRRLPPRPQVVAAVRPGEPAPDARRDP